jgi:hypothetical protein
MDDGHARVSATPIPDHHDNGKAVASTPHFAPGAMPELDVQLSQ